MRSTSISAKRVADHITLLTERYGATHVDVARASGVHERTIRFILDAKDAPHDERGVYVKTAVKIMSVRVLPPGRRLVDATGVQRRVEALSTMGWSRKEVARRAGLSDSALHPSKLGKTVWFTTDLAIKETYGRLRFSAATGPSSNQTRDIAHRLGYAPPWAWENGSIDDPDARPMLDDIENKTWRLNVKRRYFPPK